MQQQQNNKVNLQRLLLLLVNIWTAVEAASDRVQRRSQLIPGIGRFIIVILDMCSIFPCDS